MFTPSVVRSRKLFHYYFLIMQLVNSNSFLEWTVYLAWKNRLSKFWLWMAIKNFRRSTNWFPLWGRLRPMYMYTGFNGL